MLHGSGDHVRHRTVDLDCDAVSLKSLTSHTSGLLKLPAVIKLDVGDDALSALGERHQPRVIAV